ncbi:MAG: tRNA uridine-5-carboxymethylaminomethyl(34) synthesis GTPase MnmE [Christensenellales bacterium]
MKTIATISTPIGSGAIGIIRMSGDNAKAIAAQMFSTTRLDSFEDATPNVMYYGKVKTQSFDDTCLAVYFKAPSSYTGEDVVEFQCHGGVRLVNEVLKRCIDLGADIADKGEFTKRAFLNGKMALSDCEGIIDMITSESLSALKAGSRLMQGGVSGEIKEYQTQLLDCIAEMEASLDYPEEMEEESKSNCGQVLSFLAQNLQKLVNSQKLGGYIKQGVTVGIVGQTNVGKSSLLNTLVGRERAIVTDIAGTTRDTVEECLEYKGMLIRLVDTAGIRETDDKVEAIGVEKSMEIATNSDLTIFVVPADRPMNDEEKALEKSLDGSGVKMIRVINKCDLGLENCDGITVSAKTGEGIENLKQKIIDAVLGEKVDVSGNVITNQRHAAAIEQSLQNIISAKDALYNQPTECVLLDLRQAYFELGKITGDSASEDIIDSIFSKFCLGK